jgi:hypothetical protein
MIDFKRLLDGVTGLLIMAECSLVGFAVGFTVALSTAYWVKASDGMANFWGGVVGAGLGSAGALAGAVYLQQRQRSFELTPFRNQIVSSVETMRSKLLQAEMGFQGTPPNCRRRITTAFVGHSSSPGDS